MPSKTIYSESTLYQALFSIQSNTHYLNRYVKFIKYIKQMDQSKVQHETEFHHILPKSLFPEFSNLNDFPNNGCHLTYRQHFIAHWILYKAYGGKMTYAFNIMANRSQECKSSKIYEQVRRDVSNLMRTRIKEHGHPKGMLGKTHTEECKENMRLRISSPNNSFTMRGKTHSEETKLKVELIVKIP